VWTLRLPQGCACCAVLWMPQVPRRCGPLRLPQVPSGDLFRYRQSATCYGRCG